MLTELTCGFQSIARNNILASQKMIISHKYKFIFIHCPKTAGSTVQAILNRYLGPDDIQVGTWQDALQHGGRLNKNAKQAIALKSIKKPDFMLQLAGLYLSGDRERFSRKVDSVVRDRYRGVLSIHSTANTIMEWNPSIWTKYYKFCIVRNPFDHAISWFYWSNMPEQGVSFEQFLLGLRRHHEKTSGVCSPEGVMWPFFTINDSVAVDFIGKFETLSQDLGKFGEMVGIKDTLRLPEWRAKGKSRKSTGLELYDVSTKSLVQDIYRKELEFFGYSFDEFVDQRSG